MSRRFRPEPEASAELERAALWYEDERPGLGVAFLDAIDATLAESCSGPMPRPGFAICPPMCRRPIHGYQQDQPSHVLASPRR